MTTVRTAFLILILCAVSPRSAQAADIILDGEGPCVSIGGVWTSGTCTVQHLVVAAGTHLIAPAGVVLATGDVSIDGALSIFGELLAAGTLVNRGTLTTYSFIVSTAPVVNRGVWQNYGIFRADDEVVNEWVFVNRASFATGLGRFVNWGSTSNLPGSTFSSGGEQILNEGLLQNFGYLVNGSILDNFGVVRNYDGTLFNPGRAAGYCGSVWLLYDLGPGPGPIGNPIVYEPCRPTEAVAALARTVLALGQRQLIPKGDTIALLKLALKAGKQLALGHDEQAVALLDMFSAEVAARIPSTPFAEALMLRADSAAEMIQAGSSTSPTR